MAPFLKEPRSPPRACRNPRESVKSGTGTGGHCGCADPGVLTAKRQAREAQSRLSRCQIVCYGMRLWADESYRARTRRVLFCGIGERDLACLDPLLERRRLLLAVLVFGVSKEYVGRAGRPVIKYAGKRSAEEFPARRRRTVWHVERAMNSAGSVRLWTALVVTRPRRDRRRSTCLPYRTPPLRTPGGGGHHA